MPESATPQATKAEAASPKRAYVRRPHKSAFLVTAGIVVSCILAVGSVIAFLSYSDTRTMIQEEVRTRAIEVTDLLALQSAASLRFGREEGVAEPLGRVIESARGKAMSGLGYTAAAGAIAETGDVSDALRDLAKRAAETGETAISGDGFAVAVPAFAGGEVSGAVAMEWSAEASLAQMQGQMRQKLVVAGIVTVVATVLATLLLRWHLLRPLARLSNAINRIAASDYDIELPKIRREDEIGMIGKSLIEMRDALAKGAKERHVATFRSAALEASSAPIMLLDTEFKVLHANSSANDLLQDLCLSIQKVTPNFDPEQVVGQRLSQIIPLKQGDNNIFQETSRSPQSQFIAISDRRLKICLVAVLDASEKPIGYVAELSDVTGAILNQSIISALEEFQVYAEFNTDGNLEDANSQFARVFGFPHPNELKGSDIASLVGRSSGKNFLHWQQEISAGEPIKEKFLSTKEHGVVDGSLFAVVDAVGEVMKYVLMGQDITNAERELALSARRREEAERVQSAVVENLTIALRKVSEGALTTLIETPFATDYEQLRTDFNSTISALCELVGTVSEMAMDVRKEATEIAASADSLSGRTERTAATLEETAAALDELTSSVQSAAEGAQRANAVVSDTRARAIESGEVVQDAVAAMSAIEESSRKIAKIIDVIEDIAFQTNLLALNAGVEAARAGEAGRGFAVVASEVRALAQRSSDAAREINDLITASGTQVQRGVDLVGRTGEALQKILSSIVEVSDLVGGIAVSSKEQSTGVSEINTAVNQLDQVTQQNAAMFEETTAASHSLTRLAENLSTTVERFHTGNKTTNSTTRANLYTQEPLSAGQTKATAQTGATVAKGVASANGASLAYQVLEDAPSPDDGWEEF